MLTFLSMLLLQVSAGLHGAPSRASWKAEGPWFGDVVSLAVSPANPDQLYALACKEEECHGGRALWKSDNGGEWWTPAGHELADSDVVWVVPHPSIPGTVYVGTVTGREEHPGVARSTDGGVSWAWLEEPLEGLLANPPGRLIFVPGHPNELWFPNVNLHARSTDGGVHWTTFRVEVGEEASDAHGFAFAPSNPRIVWAYHDMGGLLRKSVDGGATWERITEKGYGWLGWARLSFLVDPDDPNRLFVGGGGSYGIVASTDGGATWLPLDDFPDSVTVNALVRDPSNAGTLYASTANGLFKTTDGGRSWKNITNHLPDAAKKNPVASIIVHPRSSKVLWVSLSNNGIYKSMDSGATWKECYAGMSTAPIESLSPGPNGTILAGSHAGVFSRDSAGRWKHSDETPNSDAVAVDPANPKVVYTGDDNGFRRSDDGGSTWRRADDGLPRGSVLMLRSAPGKLFVVVEGQGLWYSDDGASSWKPVSGDVPKQINDLAIDPADRNHIAVVAKLSAFHEQSFIHSKDGGKTWEPVGGALGNQELHAVAFGPGSIVFAGASSGVYCSKDGGATWSPFNDGLPRTNVAKLLCVKDSLYAGTDAGVFSIALR